MAPRRIVPTQVHATQRGVVPANDLPKNDADMDLIKANIEPFRQIFGVMIENAKQMCISRIEAGPENSDSEESTIYTLYDTSADGGEAQWAKGRAIFPPDTPTEMQTAILKLDACDVSVLAFLPYIADALHKIDARVDWLTGYMKPRSIIHYSDEELVEPLHSVFSVTTSNGKQFIADFTIEQFGYTDECWFSRKSEFLDYFTKDGQLRLAADHEILGMEEEVSDDAHMSGLVETAKVICEEIDWKIYEQLPQGERKQWVEARAQEILEGMDFEI
ncbi:Nn.00g066010.m01.CDS01 [Neocucurbitaria sp. VM-36]